jgi:hypothetical protein
MASFMPLDPSAYKWNKTTEGGTRERRACGIENLDGLEVPNKKGHNDFHIAVTSHFHDQNVNLDRLTQAVKQVWRRIRFYHPQIACAPAWKGGHLFLMYQHPGNDDEVMRWVDRTVYVELNGKGVLEVQQGLEKKRRAAGDLLESSNPASIHIIPPPLTSKDETSNVDVTFLFHLNHIFLDGSGAYTLIGLVLQDLALELSIPNRKPTAFNWETSVEYLPPAFIEILTPDQNLSGPSFDKALQTAISDTVASQTSWGLKPSGTASGGAQNEFLVLSTAETDSIKSTAREMGFNITHLAHAAVFLVGLKANPPEEGSVRSSIASYFALDDRQHIDEKQSQHKRQYLPNCHGHGNIKVDNIQEYVLGQRATPAEIRRKLIAMTTEIKGGYDSCARRPCRVSAGLAFMEMLAGMLAAYVISLSRSKTNETVTDSTFCGRNPNPPDIPMTTPVCFLLHLDLLTSRFRLKSTNHLCISCRTLAMPTLFGYAH